jgi:hypothetical protein
MFASLFQYGFSTPSIHSMNARTRRDRLPRCATTWDTASDRRCAIGWRQGHVLSDDAVAELGLAHEANAVVMVVSHDCDLANDNLDIEPSVEVIVGRTVPKTDQSLTRTKLPRILHLEVTYEGATTCVELTATAKQLIHKSRLAAWRPDPRYRLDPGGLEILRH